MYVFCATGSFQSCTPSLSHFLVKRSSRILYPAYQNATWKGAEPERWTMLPVRDSVQVTEPCRKRTNNPSAVGEQRCAKRYVCTRVRIHTHTRAHTSHEPIRRLMLLAPPTMLAGKLYKGNLVC